MDRPTLIYPVNIIRIRPVLSPDRDEEWDNTRHGCPVGQYAGGQCWRANFELQTSNFEREPRRPSRNLMGPKQLAHHDEVAGLRRVLGVVRLGAGRDIA